MTIDLPLKFTTLNDVNSYVGEFKADEPGQHRVELNGTSATIGFGKRQVNSAYQRGQSRVFGAAQNSDLLRRISAETGGSITRLMTSKRCSTTLTYRQTPYSERVTGPVGHADQFYAHHCLRASGSCASVKVWRNVRYALALSSRLATLKFLISFARAV